MRLTPGARGDQFSGVHLDADGKAWLKAAVRAAPEKGRANVALIAMLAKATGIAKGRFDLVSGHTSRTKTLRIDVIGPDEHARIEALGAE